MGVTSFTKELIEEVLSSHNPKTVCELGAQNDYSGPNLPAPYASEWYKQKGLEYTSIDLSGENGCIVADLSKPLKGVGTFDLVTDAGTGEHIEDFYECLKNLHYLCAPGGVIIRENPKTGNWPGHGKHYMTKAFYKELAKLCSYRIIKLGEHPAMGNDTDGWNVYCVMEKKDKSKFPTRAQFEKLNVPTA